MKVLISDYKNAMMPTHNYEKSILEKGLPGVEIEVFEYRDDNHEEFLERLNSADALLTAYVDVNEDVLKSSARLKLVSVNATGYDKVDLDAANRFGIGVCPVGEYCSLDVAEHAIALMLALNKNLKIYTNDVENNLRWRYDAPAAPTRIGNQTLGIFGLGKIGKQVARMAIGLGMDVIATDLHVSEAEGAEHRVKMVTPDVIYANSDVILNMMNLGKSNKEYFTAVEFSKMKRHPIFLNLARGKSIDEDALISALDAGVVRAAGLDVLMDEAPDLVNQPLLGRENVIVTPHAAFYSTDSFVELQRVSCENIVNYLNGKPENVFKLVTDF